MTTQTPLAIEASGLGKSFGDTRAVAGVDLAVPAGAIYGVLGPNGAGKTTTIRMLATLIEPDAGRPVARPPPDRGPGQGRRAAGGLRHRRGRRPARQALLRRHAPTAGHRGEHRRHPPVGVPRR